MSDLESTIRDVRFKPVRFRTGYDMGEVDVLLDRLVDAVRGDQPLGPVLASARFTQVRLREGYDMGEVDAFLARLASGWA